EGPDAVEVPRIAPPTPDAVALLLGTAHEEGWRVRVEGTGSWLPPDAPADLTLTTRRLDRVTAVEPQDLVATAEAGIGWDALRQQLADRGAWLALDPPGVAGRSLGSVVATGTAGPRRPRSSCCRRRWRGASAGCWPRDSWAHRRRSRRKKAICAASPAGGSPRCAPKKHTRSGRAPGRRSRSVRSRSASAVCRKGAKGCSIWCATS